MNSTSDLTQGRPFKLIMRFFFPLLLTNSLQQLYSFADTAIVGKGLGDDSLAAVGNMSSLCFLIIGFSMGLSNGFSILIAQSFGEKNMDKLRRTLAHSIELAAVITVLLTLFSAVFLRSILVLLRTDPSIIGESLQYGYILFGGLAATIMYNMCAGILRALGDSKTPLKAIIVSSIMNITLNSVFIFIFHWGVSGAALATIISQVFSGAVCLDKLRKTDFLALTKADFSHDARMYSKLLGNGIPMALMNSITAVGCMAVQYFVNGLGELRCKAIRQDMGRLEGLSWYSRCGISGIRFGDGIFPQMACFADTFRRKADKLRCGVPACMRNYDPIRGYAVCYQKRCAGHGFPICAYAFGHS